MILITGGTGLVGKSLQKFLPGNFIGSNDCDLRCPKQVADFFDQMKPDTVVHLAAKVGGIIDNSSRQYDFLYENTLINTNVIHNALRLDARVVALSSTCVYPKEVSGYPLREDMVQQGPAEPTNYAYAYAKRLMTTQLQAAKDQYGLSYVVVYAGNLYGPNDKFDTQRAHFVPALIARMHENLESDSIELYGTGKPMRQFTYVDDLSKVLYKLVCSDIEGSFNFATSEHLTILEITKTIAKVVGYSGRLNFNGKLDGVFRKDVDVDKLRDIMDIDDFVPLSEGVRLTYDWYKQFGV